MKIDAYEFGAMTIDGNEYTEDLVVFPDHVSPGWWRRVGHRLEPEDLTEVFDEHPDVLVVGEGASSMMRIPDLTRQVLDEHGILLLADETGAAWTLYNQLAEKGRRVIGAFHLTC